MEEIFKALLELHFRSCFARVNDNALTPERRSQLIADHRRVAFWLLFGGIFMLPFIVLYFSAAVAWGMGLERILGDSPERQLALAVFGLFFVQFLLLAAVSITCMVGKGYKGLGIVLALADYLHLSARCLQNIWRVLAALPWIPLLIGLTYVLYTFALG